MIGKALENGRRQCGMCGRVWTPRSWKHFRCPKCGCHDDELKAAKVKREATS